MALLALGASSARAESTVDELDGLDELRAAVEALPTDVGRLDGRRFTFRYRGRLDQDERVRLTIEPTGAFEITAKDRRTFEVVIRKATLLVQDDFLRSIVVRAARESETTLVGVGAGRCALAVRFSSDVGREIDLDRYPRADIEWSPKEAAQVVGKGAGHVLFRRAPGHDRTPVEVKARLTLGDGSTRDTAPVRLGYCAEGAQNGARFGLALLGGGFVEDGYRHAAELSVPLELSADERLHGRLAPAVLAWVDPRGRSSLAVLAQASVGVRFGRPGLRLGGEAGWMQTSEGRRDALRAGGWVEGFFGLAERSAVEVQLRAGGGVVADRPFAGLQLGLTWLWASL